MKVKDINNMFDILERLVVMQATTNYAISYIHYEAIEEREKILRFT